MHVSASSHAKRYRVQPEWQVLFGPDFKELKSVQAVDSYQDEYGKPGPGWLYQYVEPVRCNLKDEVVVERIPCRRIIIHEDCRLILALRDEQRPIISNEFDR